jgi:hypothetical protein
VFDFLPPDGDWPPAGSPARTLDVAKGVLAVLRRCDADEMFIELVEASRKHALSAFALAEALVAAVGGGASSRDDHIDAANVVEQE